MKQTLTSKLPLALVAVAPILLAQRSDHGATAHIDVLAPGNFVLAARALQLTAQPTNQFGAILRGKNIAWQISDSTRAAIDNTGLLFGLAPGPVNVTATDQDSGVSGVTTVYVYPGGVSISAGSTSVQVGDTLSLAAQAQDADGKPIPGVPFEWFTDVAAVAKISADGVLTGVAEGLATVTAAIDMGPGFERFTAFRAIQVVHRGAFRLKTLLSSDSAAAGTTTLAPTVVSAAGGYVGAVTSTSNGGQTLLLSHGNSVQTIAFTGSTLNGHIVIRFDSVSVNGQGDVLALADAQADWCEQLLVLFTAASKWSPTILDDTTRCGYWLLPPKALDKHGGSVFRYSNTLYYGKPDGTRQAILSVGDQPTGADVVNNISNWSATPFDKVLIETQNPSGRSIYYVWDGTQIKKLFAVGDEVANYESQWARLPQEISAGEYITRIGGQNWSSLSRLKNGVWSMVAMNGQNGVGWVQDGFDGADGYIFFFADDNTGHTLLRRTNGATTDTLGSYPSWRELSQVTATGGDSAVAYGTLGGPVPQIVSFSGTSSRALLATGAAIPGAPAPALAQRSIPKGINPSSTILRTIGDTLLQVTPSGVATLLKPGGTLPNGSLASLGGLAANRLGDLAFTAQHGPKTALYAYLGGEFQLVADTDDTLLSNTQVYGFPTYTDTLVALNNLGHIAALVNTSAGNSIFFFSGTPAVPKYVIRQGASVPGSGAVINGINALAIDDNDRIAFIANLANGKTGLFLWDQSGVRELVETGQADPAGRLYQGLYNVQAGGGQFYVRAYSGINELLALDGATVNILAYDGYVATFGTAMKYHLGQELTSNSRGDVAFPVYTASGAALFVHRADGTDTLVAIGSQRGPDGEWFLDIFGAGIGEHGDIVFSALGWAADHSRLALYQATPSN